MNVILFVVCRRIHPRKFLAYKNSSSYEPHDQFQSNFAQISFGEGDLSPSYEGPCPFTRVDKSELKINPRGQCQPNLTQNVLR